MLPNHSKEMAEPGKLQVREFQGFSMIDQPILWFLMATAVNRLHNLGPRYFSSLISALDLMYSTTCPSALYSTHCKF